MVTGKMAYQAYGEYVHWKNFQGNPMPKWEELPDNIKGAWQAAVDAVINIWVNQQTASEKCS